MFNGRLAPQVGNEIQLNIEQLNRPDWCPEAIKVSGHILRLCLANS